MIFYLTIIFGLIIDLFIKYLSKIYLQNEEIQIISDFFTLKYVENTGIAFSISIPFLKIVTIILILGILWYYFKEEKNKNDKIIDFSFGLVLAGAIGNGVERIFNGFVIDFLSIKYFSIFNLADVFITIGAFIYLFRIFTEKNK